MSLPRDPEKLRAWQKRSKPLARGAELKRTGSLKRSAGLAQRGKGKRAVERRKAKEGPQWELCHVTACAVCWALERRRQGQPLAWSELPQLEPGARRSEGHHEPEAQRRDENTMPLGASRVAGGCGHHEERTRKGAARFWGWRQVRATGEWEHVGGGLEIHPGEILAEMRSRVGWGT